VTEKKILIIFGPKKKEVNERWRNLSIEKLLKHLVKKNFWACSTNKRGEKFIKYVVEKYEG
jgi:predicted transcriptional regulator